MTPQEALTILYKGIAPNPTANNECIELCKEALEKQIPKKPVFLRFSTNRTFACICNARVKKSDKHCRVCGQALDWGDSE